MLKIEKVNRHHEYSIELRKREGFFNRTFLTSLLFAFLLHATALLIFHIGPFKILNNTQLLPAFVETDMIEPDQQIVAKIDGERKLLRFPFAPRVSAPKLPSMPKHTVMRYLENIQEVNFLDNPFLKVERDLQKEIFFASKEVKSDKNSIEIVPRGQLEGKKFEILDGLQELKQMPIMHHAIYSVKVENKTGRIFFVEPIYHSANDQYVNVIDKLLRRIRFEKDSKGFVTSGDIEIVFNGS